MLCNFKEMSYIGALGVNTFDDEIEDASNILVNRIVSDINHTLLYTSTCLQNNIPFRKLYPY